MTEIIQAIQTNNTVKIEQIFSQSLESLDISPLGTLLDAIKSDNTPTSQLYFLILFERFVERVGHLIDQNRPSENSSEQNPNLESNNNYNLYVNLNNQLLSLFFQLPMPSTNLIPKFTHCYATIVFFNDDLFVQWLQTLTNLLQTSQKDSFILGLSLLDAFMVLLSISKYEKRKSIANKKLRSTDLELPNLLLNFTQMFYGNLSNDPTSQRIETLLINTLSHLVGCISFDIVPFIRILPINKCKSLLNSSLNNMKNKSDLISYMKSKESEIEPSADLIYTLDRMNLRLDLYVLRSFALFYKSEWKIPQSEQQFLLPACVQYILNKNLPISNTGIFILNCKFEEQDIATQNYIKQVMTKNKITNADAFLHSESDSISNTFSSSSNYLSGNVPSGDFTEQDKIVACTETLLATLRRDLLTLLLKNPTFTFSYERITDRHLFHFVKLYCTLFTGHNKNNKLECIADSLVNGLLEVLYVREKDLESKLSDISFESTRIIQIEQISHLLSENTQQFNQMSSKDKFLFELSEEGERLYINGLDYVQKFDTSGRFTENIKSAVQNFGPLISIDIRCKVYPLTLSDLEQMTRISDVESLRSTLSSSSTEIAPEIKQKCVDLLTGHFLNLSEIKQLYATDQLISKYRCVCAVQNMEGNFSDNNFSGGSSANYKILFIDVEQSNTRHISHLIKTLNLVQFPLQVYEALYSRLGTLSEQNLCDLIGTISNSNTQKSGANQNTSSLLNNFVPAISTLISSIDPSTTTLFTWHDLLNATSDVKEMIQLIGCGDAAVLRKTLKGINKFSILKEKSVRGVSGQISPSDQNISPDALALSKEMSNSLTIALLRAYTMPTYTDAHTDILNLLVNVYNEEVMISVYGITENDKIIAENPLSYWKTTGWSSVKSMRKYLKGIAGVRISEMGKIDRNVSSSNHGNNKKTTGSGSKAEFDVFAGFSQ